MGDLKEFVIEMYWNDPYVEHVVVCKSFSSEDVERWAYMTFSPNNLVVMEERQ